MKCASQPIQTGLARLVRGHVLSAAEQLAQLRARMLKSPSMTAPDGRDDLCTEEQREVAMELQPVCR